MITIKRVPDEDVYYDWEDQIDLMEEADDLLIMGDRHYVLFGNSTVKDIVNGDFYDDAFVDPYDYETIPELNKVLGGDWDYTEFKGYSQGDWCGVWYNKNKVSEGLLYELEVYIMGKADEFVVQEDDDPDDTYHVLVPHDVVWKGAKAVCEFLGIDFKDAVVLEDDGYEKVYHYKRMED